MGIKPCSFFLAVLVGFATTPINADIVKPFSTMSGLDDGWSALDFPRVDRHTRYTLITEDETQVVQADTDNSASGRIARISIEPGEKMLLRWRWKVSSVYENGDARQKNGDDYPARIYVAFAFQPEKAGLLERAKRKAVEVFYGNELPGNALNYIWANRLPLGAMVPNPYTDETRMIAVTSGGEKAGEWVTVERDIVSDYRTAFGEPPPTIIGIGIMTDSDNTGESATAWYGDIELIRIEPSQKAAGDAS
ncbi:DUF3047 domain-containing protein [Marinobacter fonticola]|uniref:DUF3047 domain-containing protein n=1 Tax=Marinobacter fonticola TaxID=2603215 RepID=UPI0011E87D04|nr:DUF3047 domain-containing protein [Marinobacter fonticola]